MVLFTRCPLRTKVFPYGTLQLNIHSVDLLVSLTLTEDATMSSVTIAACELLPDTPPGSVSGKLDEDMSEPTADGIQKMDTIDQS